ncbi:ubiquitin carboxyl-terminal hydrolase 1 [Pectinophora gossypiella]|uniref:ubiquitin carboxyl-terminal hydrolase 1 n=1 Tax=Pectinophora gossypiella TaxID=13191 RepID=UPI00214E8047|nr:ubiquitin carboxyl-terminal hydrolase 1 [Pectinophora gossypiella]
MPVNPVSAKKKGVEKPKFSLSLNRNNATYLINGNTKLADSKENSQLCKLTKDNKENKPLKRPFASTYFNTLHAAKKLKPLTETPKLTEKLFEPEVLIVEEPASQASTAMLNGHHTSDSQYGGPPRKTPIATLSNLGNTCFLNSVLYTLRYAPRFLHNLHHLVSDLASVEQKLGSIRLKSSSLGRSAAGLAASGARSWSSKDLLSLGQSDNSSGKSKIQIATEKLHETYLNLRCAESKCLNSSAESSPEPYAADAFLAALRDVNSTFEGNRQQDAHELLVCILDNIRETCRALSNRASRLQLQENGDSNGIGRQPSLDGDGGKPSLGNLRKSWKKRKEVKDKRGSPTEERAPSPAPADERSRPGWDFVADDFEGTMVVRTMCLECEGVTEKAQAVCELCVPVGDDDATPDEPFRAACLSAEYLRDQNKYWCERCLRYNEARRSVAYSRLPRLLVLQLKRFSGGMEKITRHAPTPLLMPCFCEPCARRAPDHAPQHRYILWAVIMHLGQTLSGGHYVAYARAAAEPADGRCEREGGGDAAPPHSGTSFMRTLFNRPRPAPTGCSARECCVPRPRAAAGWLACDDDLVKPISNEDFEDLLSAEPKVRSAATPYLLFYVKSEVG